jgi:hypothetical protein
MNTDVVIEVLEVGTITSVDVIGDDRPVPLEEEIRPSERPDVCLPVA